MYGHEIARVLTHENGYTVETKTKPRTKKSAGNGPVAMDGETMPNHEWESHVATSKKEVLQRVSAAHEAHQDSLLQAKYRGMKK